MKFGIFLLISLYRYLRISLWQSKLIFDTINWTTWVILKMMSKLLNSARFSPESNDFIYCLLLSRVITESNFNFIIGVEIKSCIPHPLFKPFLPNAQSAWIVMFCVIWYHLYNFKNVKNPRKSVTLGKDAGFKPATLLKVTLLHGFFNVF